ncbi:MAG: hypothetical protein EBW58_11510, partial [Betaproteobacteria bacterium]|nr:hypothetical protein [Betaproteobacteria bacterium]
MIVIAILVALIAAVVHAPASWLDEWAGVATKDRVRLAQASGTLWSGQAFVVFRFQPSDGSSSTAQRTAKSSGLALPYPLQWKLNPFSLLAGGPALELRMQGLDRPLRLAFRDQIVQVPAGQLDLPRLDFSALGSPWNSLQPSARLQLRWSELLLVTDVPASARSAGAAAGASAGTSAAGASSGRLSLTINDLAARISPVQPLGSYEWQIDLTQLRRWELRTLDGALDLRALPEAGRGVRIEARPKPAEESRLRPLLSLMGTREADATVMRL